MGHGQRVSAGRMKALQPSRRPRLRCEEGLAAMWGGCGVCPPILQVVRGLLRDVRDRSVGPSAIIEIPERRARCRVAGKGGRGFCCRTLGRAKHRKERTKFQRKGAQPRLFPGQQGVVGGEARLPVGQGCATAQECKSCRPAGCRLRLFRLAAQGFRSPGRRRGRPVVVRVNHVTDSYAYHFGRRVEFRSALGSGCGRFPRSTLPAFSAPKPGSRRESCRSCV